jgi:hypothetical protein
MFIWSDGFTVQQCMASQRRIHELRTCYLISFCSEDGGNISLWNTIIHIQVHTVSQIIQPQCENFVLLFHFSLLAVHMRWRKKVCNITYNKVIFYMLLYVVDVCLHIYIYIYIFYRMEGLKGARSEVMCVGIRLFIELLSHRFPCYFFVVVFGCS